MFTFYEFWFIVKNIFCFLIYMYSIRGFQVYPLFCLISSCRVETTHPFETRAETVLKSYLQYRY